MTNTSETAVTQSEPMNETSLTRINGVPLWLLAAFAVSRDFNLDELVAITQQKEAASPNGLAASLEPFVPQLIAERILLDMGRELEPLVLPAEIESALYNCGVLTAVHEYARIIREERLLDKLMEREEIDLSQPLATGVLKVWPEAIDIEVSRCRGQMKKHFTPLTRTAVPRQGLIYFIQSGDAGYIKIGHTNDIRQRLTSLQTGSGEVLHLRATMNGTDNDEKRLHQRFKRARKHGEWFEPTPKLLTFIAGLQTRSHNTNNEPDDYRRKEAEQ